MSEIPELMSAVVLTGHGGPEKLVYQDAVKVPIPGPRDVLVRVAAAGVNNTDINTREAWYSKSSQSTADASWSGNALHFPRIQGADVCGSIVRVGNQISQDRVGQRVLIEPLIREANGKHLTNPWYFGSECDGGFAQYTVVASRHAHEIHSSYTDVELASFPCSYSTAENMLTRANVTQQDRVLVTGASGGVGSAAVQLVKARGAYVVAVTTPAKASALKALGADEIASRDDDLVTLFGTNSFDVVLDLVAGQAWPSLLEVLTPGGRYAVSGAIAGPLVELDVRTLYLKDLSLFGCTVLEPEIFPNLIGLIEQERVAPLVSNVFALNEIAAAQTTFLAKNHVGKIVITIE